IEAMLNELRREAGTTKRVLEQVPTDKLSWQPHPKSMSLGQLANHIATIPATVTRLAQDGGFDTENANFNPDQPESKEVILKALEDSLQKAETYLIGLDEESAAQTWRLTSKGKEIFGIPRSEMLRSIMLNHWYHHRGQLSVYLRLLDVSVPAIYGRSADENPFA
ncbi:MAG: DinB family protein, partial [Blastocatellia bacterium]